MSKPAETSGHFVEVITSLADIDASGWNACANPDTGNYNPFLDHRFLHALEVSGSATIETGWLGQHMLLRNGEKNLLAAMPCYLKNHSQGEYVFDYGWADAFERAGGRYYPKLQVSVPFTPATGRRLLTKPGPQEDEHRMMLASAAAERARQIEASSIHATFMSKDEWEQLGALGYLQRTDQQFHFESDGYQNFDDFLAALASRKRKQLKKERRTALENDVTVDWISGSDITETHLDHFFEFYMDTGSRKWGTPYLTRAFFSLITEAMPEKLLFIFAMRNGTPVAGAMNMIGGDTLYGRYWGCSEHHPFLHFEVCYYQAIDYALEHGLTRVEAGAQGGHKLVRGYMPVTTYSAHWIANPSFREAIDAYLQQERQAVERENAALAEHAPFRKGELQDKC